MTRIIPLLVRNFSTSFGIGNFLLAVNLLFNHIANPALLVLQLWSFCGAITIFSLIQLLNTTPIVNYMVVLTGTSILYLTFASLYHWMPINGLTISLTVVGFALWFILSWLIYWQYSRWLAHRVNVQLQRQ